MIWVYEFPSAPNMPSTIAVEIENEAFINPMGVYFRATGNKLLVGTNKPGQTQEIDEIKPFFGALDKVEINWKQWVARYELGQELVQQYRDSVVKERAAKSGLLTPGMA